MRHTRDWHIRGDVGCMADSVDRKVGTPRQSAGHGFRDQLVDLFPITYTSTYILTASEFTSQLLGLLNSRAINAK